MSETNIKEFLKHWTTVQENSRAKELGWKYASLHDLVLNEGEYLSKEPFTIEEEEWLLELFAWIGRPIKVRTCYETAFKLSNWSQGGFLNEIKNPEFIKEYGEGYGVTDLLFPIEHAVFILNGKPIDIVWRPNRREGNSTKSPKNFLKRARWCLENNTYYMIRFPIKYATEFIYQTQTYGVIEFNREIVEKGREAWAGGMQEQQDSTSQYRKK